MMKSRVELYLDHLDELIGAEPQFQFLAPEGGPLPRITSIIYPDQPEDGLLTAFTYGLSLTDHPDWKLGAPELVLCVGSRDFAWGWAIPEVAARLRGQCPFCIGDTINFRERIADESAVSAFFVLPTVLDREAATINLPDRPVHIVGMYSIYGGEIDLIRRTGPAAFWDLDGFDPYDVHRPDLSRRSCDPPPAEGRDA
jgi:Suppressor of fused protein (SUFU)